MTNIEINIDNLKIFLEFVKENWKCENNIYYSPNKDGYAITATQVKNTLINPTIWITQEIDSVIHISFILDIIRTTYRIKIDDFNQGIVSHRIKTFLDDTDKK
jgi:hypothetical protein